MSSELVGVLVMLNNYFHDLAVAVFFCATLASWLLGREAERQGLPRSYRTGLFRRLSVISVASLVWILLGGVVRAVAYQEYEWMAAAGRGQIPALVVKHIILVTTVAVAAYLHLRQGRRLAKGAGGATPPEDPPTQEARRSASEQTRR